MIKVSKNFSAKKPVVLTVLTAEQTKLVSGGAPAREVSTGGTSGYSSSGVGGGGKMLVMTYA